LPTTTKSEKRWKIWKKNH